MNAQRDGADHFFPFKSDLQPTLGWSMIALALSISLPLEKAPNSKDQTNISSPPLSPKHLPRQSSLGNIVVWVKEGMFVCKGPQSPGGLWLGWDCDSFRSWQKSSHTAWAAPAIYILCCVTFRLPAESRKFPREHPDIKSFSTSGRPERYFCRISAKDSAEIRQKVFLYLFGLSVLLQKHFLSAECQSFCRNCSFCSLRAVLRVAWYFI